MIILFYPDKFLSNLNPSIKFVWGKDLVYFFYSFETLEESGSVLGQRYHLSEHGNSVFSTSLIYQDLRNISKCIIYNHYASVCTFHPTEISDTLNGYLSTFQFFCLPVIYFGLCVSFSPLHYIRNKISIIFLQNLF